MPSPNSPTKHIAATEMELAGRGKHCGLSSPQRMAESPLLVGIIEGGQRPALLPSGQLLPSHSWLCVGMWRVSLSLRSVSINKGVVTMDIPSRVLQTGMVEIVNIY